MIQQETANNDGTGLTALSKITKKHLWMNFCVKVPHALCHRCQETRGGKREATRWKEWLSTDVFLDFCSPMEQNLPRPSVSVTRRGQITFLLANVSITLLTKAIIFAEYMNWWMNQLLCIPAKSCDLPDDDSSLWSKKSVRTNELTEQRCPDGYRFADGLTSRYSVCTPSGNLSNYQQCNG